MHDVAAGKEEDDVAVGMAVREVYGADFLAVEVDAQRSQRARHRDKPPGGKGLPASHVSKPELWRDVQRLIDYFGDYGIDVGAIDLAEDM